MKSKETECCRDEKSFLQVADEFPRDPVVDELTRDPVVDELTRVVVLSVAFSLLVGFVAIGFCDVSGGSVSDRVCDDVCGGTGVSGVCDGWPLGRDWFRRV